MILTNAMVAKFSCHLRHGLCRRAIALQRRLPAQTNLNRIQSYCLGQHDSGSSIATLLIRGPQGQVITQQLHDERRVLVRIFRHVVQLGNGILESSASHLACLVWVAQNFVMEDREVEGQTQPDGVSHCKLAGSTHCIIICPLGLVCSTRLLVTISELSNVPKVVALHLVVEDLRLSILCSWNQ